MVNSREQYDLHIEKKFPAFHTDTFNSFYKFTLAMYLGKKNRNTEKKVKVTLEYFKM